MTPLYDQFAQMAMCHGEKLAIVTPTQQWSYHQLHELVLQWSEVVTAACMQTRPRVAVIHEDLVQSTAIALALAKLGGVCVPGNEQLQSDQLRLGWQVCDVNLIICSETIAARKGSGLGVGYAFLVSDSPKGLPRTTSNHKFFGEDFLITLSSGSTGAPKPIVIDQACKLARAEQTQQLYGVTALDRILCSSPFFHSLGQRLTFVPLTCGATLVLLPKFTPSGWLNLVADHKVSFVIAVSSHLYALKGELLSNAAALKSLRTIVTSSAPIDAEFKRQLFAAIGCEFHEIYGTTEVAIASNLSPQQAEKKHHTVGIACDNIDIIILNDEGDVAQSEEVGEIAVKTPLMFSGYYAQPQLTEMSIKNGYFLTGDLGKVDADNFLIYVGRKKDIIICGGINVYPKDIETVILQHPSISEVAVVGVADDLLGEVIVAICVGQVSSGIEIELRQLCNKELAPYQRPLKLFFRDSLPLTATGKVSKLALREEFSGMGSAWTASLRMMLYGRRD